MDAGPAAPKVLNQVDQFYALSDFTAPFALSNRYEHVNDQSFNQSINDE